jgi:hypothetical protein
MNYFSHHIGSLLFEHRIDPSGELSGYRHNRFSGCPIVRVALIHQAVELPKLGVLHIADQAAWISLLRSLPSPL